jgi:predicted transcriptional regulator
MGTAAVEREEAEDLATTLGELVSMGRLLKVYDPETGTDRYAPVDELLRGRQRERTYTAGQLARMLGCSLRSIYRWEEAGVIPRAKRVERGKVSARIYTASQVEEIRSSVQARLNFDFTLSAARTRLKTFTNELT